MPSHRSAISSLFALGCIASCGTSSDGPEQAVGTTELTYHKDIVPIVNAQCAGCHSEGGIGGFSLLDPSVAAEKASMIATLTAARAMPPMPVNNDGSCNTFSNARWLSDDEIGIIQRWAKAGAPLGNAKDAPARPVADSPRMTGEIKTFDLGTDYVPKASGDVVDDYHCFIVDPGIAADTFITGFDIKPGNAKVVHHAALFGLPDAAAEANAAALDEAEDGPGYTCFGAPGLFRISLYGGWTPGTGPTLFPDGTGIRYGGGTKLVLQMHYNVPPTEEDLTDRSTVQLRVNSDPGLKRASFVPISSLQISLPPGQASAETSAEIPVSALAEGADMTSFKGIRALGVFPHMHTAGRTLRTVATAPDGTEQCLTDVDRWDFHWQGMWWFDEPVDISAGSSIRLACGYDTRTRTKITVFGESTDDEMCTNPIYLTTY
jgi:hypothetical protein